MKPQNARRGIAGCLRYPLLIFAYDISNSNSIVLPGASAFGAGDQGHLRHLRRGGLCGAAVVPVSFAGAAGPEALRRPPEPRPPRGEESDRDEDFVRQLCAGYQIPLTVGRTQVQAQGRGLEDAARRARYTFLESLDPAAKIATAHTADDNAETVLLHLIRGAGLRGLGGIAPARGRVIRPMLGVTRQEVEAFLGHWNLPHVEDSSNGQPDFLRNRVREPGQCPCCGRKIPGLPGAAARPP